MMAAPITFVALLYSLVQFSFCPYDTKQANSNRAPDLHYCLKKSIRLCTPVINFLKGKSVMWIKL